MRHTPIQFFGKQRHILLANQELPRHRYGSAHGIFDPGARLINLAIFSAQ